MAAAAVGTVAGRELITRRNVHIPHMAEKWAGGKACVKAASYAPRSGRRALTRAAPRLCCWAWG